MTTTHHGIFARAQLHHNQAVSAWHHSFVQPCLFTPRAASAFPETRLLVMAVAPQHASAHLSTHVMPWSQVVPNTDLVVGDVLLVNMGDKVVADGIMIDGFHLVVDEASLTGEHEQARPIQTAMYAVLQGLCWSVFRLACWRQACLHACLMHANAHMRMGSRLSPGVAGFDPLAV